MASLKLNIGISQQSRLVVADRPVSVSEHAQCWMFYGRGCRQLFRTGGGGGNKVKTKELLKGEGAHKVQKFLQNQKGVREQIRVIICTTQR